MARFFLLTTLAALAIGTTTTSARADSSHTLAPPRERPTATGRLRWAPSWGRFSVADGAITLAFAATGFGAKGQPSSESTRRVGGVLFDDAIAKASRDLDVGAFARTGSDVVGYALYGAPFVLDAGLLAGLRHRSPEVALQMALIDVEAMAVVVGVHGVVSLAIARERPYGAQCGGSLAADSPDCIGDRRYRSFFSNHAVHAFNSAGLVCSHHLKLRLWGSGPADALTCATALAAASAVATLRVLGDQHYATDVIAGAATGALIGFGVPLLHYAGGIPTLELGRRGRDGTMVSVAPTSNGVSVSGIF